MYDIHPFCAFVPEMNPTELRSLVESIKANGQQDPIVLFEGKVLDGRSRQIACAEIGIEPRYREYDGDDPAGFVEAMTTRRDLTREQRALVACRFMAHEKELAKERQKVANPSGSREPQGSPKAGGGRARDIVGARFNVTGATVARVDRILREGNQTIIDQLTKGQIKLGEAVLLMGHRPLTGKVVAAQRKVRVNAYHNRTPEQIAKANAKRDKELSRQAALLNEKFTMPGTGFTRMIMGALEVTALNCHRVGEEDARAIATKFIKEFDWSLDPLSMQYERCLPLIRALLLIDEHFQRMSSSKDAA